MKLENWMKWTAVVAALGTVSVAGAQDAKKIAESLTISRRPTLPRGKVVQAPVAGEQDIVVKQTVQVDTGGAGQGQQAQVFQQVTVADSKQVGNSLTLQRLPKGAIEGGKIYVPPSDLAYYGGWFRPNPPSDDGIPIGNIPRHVSDEFPNGAYQGKRIVQLILKSIDKCRDEKVGQRIVCYEGKIGTIIAVSGERIDQRLLRFTLNRAVDVVHHFLPFAGRNSDAIADLTVNFYENMLYLGAAFINNDKQFCSNLDSLYQVTTQDTAQMILDIQVADFGRIFLDQLYDLSRNSNLSQRARAVVLMRALGYLGWDLASDLKFREPAVAEAMIDVYELQASPTYERLLASITNDKEPVIADVNAFKNQIFKIKSALPKQLQDAGVIKKDPDFYGSMVSLGLGGDADRFRAALQLEQAPRK